MPTWGMAVNRWPDTDHALAYLAVADTIPHRTEGEAALCEFLPGRCDRVLDLGTGDGRLLAIVLTVHPAATSVAVDVSPAMLAAARERFEGDAGVTIVEHDLSDPLDGVAEAGGPFDAVVSSFAIHHLDHDRKRSLYGEVLERLRPGGAFLNLEHVSSPTEALHHDFLAALDIAPSDEDPSNQLLDVETQLGWLRDLGFVDVDCHWKWRELALLAGRRPG